MQQNQVYDCISKTDSDSIILAIPCRIVSGGDEADILSTDPLM